MSLTELLKIVGWLIVLGLAVVVMMLLSDFEYQMRKDRVQYDQLWIQEFEKSTLDTLWSTNDGDLGILVSDGTLNLTPGQDKDNLQFKPILPSDSLYIEMRLKWPHKDIVGAKVELVETGGRVIPLFNNGKGDEGFVTIHSEKLLCANCHHFNFIMNKVNASGLSDSYTQWQIDYIRLFSFQAQEKLF